MSDDFFKKFSHRREEHDHDEHRDPLHGKHGGDDWHIGHGSRHGRHGNGLSFHPASVIAAVAGNKVLLVVLVLGGFLALGFAVMVVAAILSTAGPLLDFVAENGLKGVVDAARSVAQLLWEGSGK